MKKGLKHTLLSVIKPSIYIKMKQWWAKSGTGTSCPPTDKHLIGYSHKAW